MFTSSICAVWSPQGFPASFQLLAKDFARNSPLIKCGDPIERTDAEG